MDRFNINLRRGIEVLVKKVPAWLLSLVLTILALVVLCYGLAALLKVLLPNGI